MKVSWLISIYLFFVFLKVYKINANVLNVCKGPRTNYKTKSYKQITANARYQNKKLGKQYTNGLKRGVVTTVTKIKNGFGSTTSGVDCMKLLYKNVK